MLQTILKKPELYDLLYQDVKEDISLYKTLLKDYNEIVEYEDKIEEIKHEA